MEIPRSSHFILVASAVGALAFWSSGCVGVGTGCVSTGEGCVGTDTDKVFTNVGSASDAGPGTGGDQNGNGGTGADTGTGGSGAGAGTGGSGSSPATGSGGKAAGTGGAKAGTGGVKTGTGGFLGAGGAGGFSGPGTTVQGIFIPNDHPRLFWTPDRLAQAKSWWASHSFTPRSDQYSVSDQLFAYEMTGNATYCQEAITNTMAIDLSACLATSSGCDDSRWYGEESILTYDWCYSVMSDSQKSTFLSNWNTWLNNIRMQTWGGVGMSQSNYYFGNLRNNLEWGIASYYENQTQADGFLTDGLTTRYKNDFIPASTTAGRALGGLALEGGEYGSYQGAYVASTIFPSIESSGLDIWNQTPYWKGTVLNRIYMTPPQPTVTVNGTRSGWDVFPFDDDEQWENGAPAAAMEKGTFMTVAANQWSQSNIGKWARQWVQMVSPDVASGIASTDTGGPVLDFSSLPLDYYDAGPKYLTGRSDWTANASSYMWQLGDHYSDGHNHDDWGTFQIHRKGRWLTRETVGYSVFVPGYGGAGSQPIDSGFAHNVPLVNQLPGVIAQGVSPGNGQGVAWSASPVVHRLENQAAYAYADVDLTGVYTTQSGGGNTAAVHVEREFWFLRDIETFVVLDRLQSDTAVRSKSFIFHCETNPALVDANHVNCVNGDQKLAVTTLLPVTPASRTVIDESKVTTPAPAANVQYRVEISDSPNATVSYTLHVMQAMDASGTALAPSLADSNTASATTGTFTVNLDANHHITINKGITSAGGTIAISGSTKNLRTDVEPFALDSTDTPVWGP
jgi:hypothetical protein